MQYDMQRMSSESNIDNYEIIDRALDCFIKSCKTSQKDTTVPQEFILLKKEESEKEDIFLTSTLSVEKCMEFEKHHSSFCSKSLKISRQIRHGHVLACNMICKDKHTYRWSSSPYVEGALVSPYLVNLRMYFGYMCSGMLSCEYERFVEGSRIGSISFEKRRDLSEIFREAISENFAQSISNARFEEISLKSIDCNEQQPMDIMSDARHGWRKNAKDTSVVALGDLSHKVIACEHVTTSDDPISQRHEIVGSKRIAEDLQKDNITIGIWGHNYSASLNSIVDTLPYPALSQNETWHDIKNLKKELTKVSTGPK